MIRNGRRTSSLIRAYLFVPKCWVRKNSQNNFFIERKYSTEEGSKGGKGKGKSPKGVTAKVEECLPVGSQKKLSAASMKTCPPPLKVKIPSCAPVKPPPKICSTKTDVCDHQPKYDACRAGGLKNPVVQVCKKPNMMEDCCKAPPICPEDPKESKRKYIRNLILSLLTLGLLSFAFKEAHSKTR